MTALLDTSFLFALADTSDRHHRAALEVARHLTDPLILPTLVLPEICYLLASRLGHSAMRRFLRELIASDTFLEPVDLADLKRIHEILDQYADSRLDFVDAVIVAIAERRNVRRILTLDRRHFGMIRPRHCAYFQILPAL
ncbi:MAG TPA: PIN domain-containing protein [Anaerolineae bacterium]|nr:PIN domain-containing protein [Anaerolineae bacterium]